MATGEVALESPKSDIHYELGASYSLLNGSEGKEASFSGPLDPYDPFNHLVWTWMSLRKETSMSIMNGEENASNPDLNNPDMLSAHKESSIVFSLYFWKAATLYLNGSQTRFTLDISCIRTV